MALWMEFKQEFAEDYMHHHPHLTVEEATNMALIYIEDTVTAMGGPQLQDVGMPKASREAAERANLDYQREIAYDVEQQRQKTLSNIDSMTNEQLAVFQHFSTQINNGQSGMYFLHAPGGCGKTFFN